MDTSCRKFLQLCGEDVNGQTSYVAQSCVWSNWLYFERHFYVKVDINEMQFGMQTMRYKNVLSHVLVFTSFSLFQYEIAR
jgi:hypothetical protein